MTDKLAKTKQILECIKLVAEHFNVNAEELLTSHRSKSLVLGEARTVLWHHMHQCGMDWHSIARQFGRGKNNENAALSVNYVYQKARKVTSLARYKTAILDRLPNIENTNPEVLK